MKKAGFTLAEVLITLTIIGVVAALTVPSLYYNVSTADIGPKLAKFRSTVENANKLMLVDNDVNKLSALIRKTQEGRVTAYTDLLRNFMRLDAGGDPISNITTYAGDSISRVNVNLASSNGKEENAGSNQLSVPLTDDGGENATGFTFRTVEGMAVHFFIPDAVEGQAEPDNLGVILVDINGNPTPNRLGKDIFGFVLRNDGLLTPIGSRTVSWFSTGEADGSEKDSESWINSCKDDGTVESQGLTCTGSIFANDLKVVYQN